ncbi:MAG: acyltransferase [Eubacterium sp.]|nr:acyltransferase [Eubacterium sp.]
MDRRVHYIDNLRWITVSLLILFHAAIAYNTWEEANYIFFEPVKGLAAIVSFISPWFMPLMFLLAGVSSKYSLGKRGYKSFIRERFVRLGIPLIFGILVINPILCYIADVTHNGYKGRFFSHYEVYFTRFTDLTGYDGGFTLGHFWFIAVLIVVSLLACLVIRLIGPFDSEIDGSKKEADVDRMDGKTAGRKKLIIGIVFTVLAVVTFDLKVSGKQVYTYLCLYLLGYFFFSDESFVRKLAGLKWIYVFCFLIFSAVNVALFIFIGKYETLNTVCNYLSFVTGILALISVGHDHLDKANPVTSFNSRTSYVFYIIHFPVVVLCQYFLGKAGVGNIMNYLLTIIITYPLVYMLCFLIDKTKFLRILFGLKRKKV